MDRIFARAASLVLLAASSSPARAAQYSAVDLYPLQAPAGLAEPGAYSAFAGEVVGYASDTSDPDAYPTPPPHAVLWNQAGSVVDLTLNDATGVSSTDGIHQVGAVKTGQVGNFPTFTPVVWSGSAASATFLSKQGFASAGLRGGGGGQFVGSGVIQNLVPDQAEHALLWQSLAAQPIDLNPTNLVGFVYSHAFATSGTEQVGYGYGYDANHNDFSHALLWTGSAGSAVDLHPTKLPGIVASIALATDGRQQVGNGGANEGYGHALLWSGSANSAVDLTPPGFSSSNAYGVRNGKQVGDGDPTNDDLHALLWSGTAASAVDLHLLLPNSFGWSTAYSIDDAGDVFGVAFNWSDQQYHAVEWLTVPELSGDFNRDHQVTAADIPAMLQALTDLNSYKTTNSLSDANLLAIGDLDSSGSVTNRDIQALISLVANNIARGIGGGSGSVTAVPEPGSIVLFALGALAIAVCRRSRWTAIK